jgi:hypothetical protein
MFSLVKTVRCRLLASRWPWPGTESGQPAHGRCSGDSHDRSTILVDSLGLAHV